MRQFLLIAFLGSYFTADILGVRIQQNGFCLSVCRLVCQSPNRRLFYWEENVSPFPADIFRVISGVQAGVDGAQARCRPPESILAPFPKAPSSCYLHSRPPSPLRSLPRFQWYSNSENHTTRSSIVAKNSCFVPSFCFRKEVNITPRCACTMPSN